MNVKYIFTVVVSMAIWGCGQISVSDFVPVQDGTFSVLQDGSYDISLSETKSSFKCWYGKADGMDIRIEEQNWNADDCLSKSGIYNEIEWKDEPLVGVYITDTDQNILRLSGADTDGSIQYMAANIALNPRSYIVYDLYYKDTDHTEPQSLSKTSFFWELWSKKECLTDGQKVNFYGVYPRPFDLYKDSGPGTIYKRNSLITALGFWSAKEDWYSVHYEIWGQQTDENISQMDLMFSSPQEATEKIAGNLNKEKTDNVLMQFRHAFCLLNIEIYKGENYVGEGKISALSISGPEISTTGKLDIRTGELTQDVMVGRISRECAEGSKTEDGIPFRTSMIVPPFGGSEGGAVLKCTVDGVEYQYVFPETVSLEGGKKYALKLTLSPSGISTVNVWNGAEIHVNGDESARTGSVSINKGTFTVSLKDGYSGYFILKNGKEKISSDSDEYNVEDNAVYNVVTIPSNWYVSPELARVQFDGGWNNALSPYSDNTVYTWSDLTGHGNDGNLQRFNSSETSGWNVNGLVFDGIDDIVVFPGTINPSEYTMEFYLCFNPQNEKSVTPRLNAEGTDYPAYYLRRSKGSWTVGLYGHNCSMWDSDLYIDADGKTIVQLDMVYKNKTLVLYKNGTNEGLSKYSYAASADAVSITEASLGNRIADNTRTTAAVYYSYILYDKALTADEIKHNYKVNVSRYGTSK